MEQGNVPERRVKQVEQCQPHCKKLPSSEWIWDIKDSIVSSSEVIQAGSCDNSMACVCKSASKRASEFLQNLDGRQQPEGCWCPITRTMDFVDKKQDLSGKEQWDSLVINEFDIWYICFASLFVLRLNCIGRGSWRTMELVDYQWICSVG